MQPPGAEKHLTNIDGDADSQRAGDAEAAEQTEAVAIEYPAEDQGLREIVGEGHPSQRRGPAKQHLSLLEIGNADDGGAIAQCQQDGAEWLCQEADLATGMGKEQCRAKADAGGSNREEQMA